jgi:hypothetical protein
VKQVAPKPQNPKTPKPQKFELLFDIKFLNIIRSINC